MRRFTFGGAQIAKAVDTNSLKVIGNSYANADLLEVVE